MGVEPGRAARTGRSTGWGRLSPARPGGQGEAACPPKGSRNNNFAVAAVAHGPRGARVSKRHARVRAPHLPVSQCADDHCAKGQTECCRAGRRRRATWPSARQGTGGKTAGATEVILAAVLSRWRRDSQNESEVAILGKAFAPRPLGGAGPTAAAVYAAQSK